MEDVKKDEQEWSYYVSYLSGYIERLEDATENNHSQAMQLLKREYVVWLAWQGFPDMSADKLLEDLTKSKTKK